MLPELRTSSRPKPPAKARKLSLLLNSNPPPPYSSRDSILGSPIPVTAQLLGSSSDSTYGSPAPEEWILEKSREELSELLLKADGIIKSRESELGLTSAICKSLYQDNVILKSKHDALMTRLPNSYKSPVGSPLGSPRYHTLDLPRSATDIGIITSPSTSLGLVRRKRTRRISMTPTEIGELSDQNAELLHQIQKLESESMQADQAGKRKLRKLETEIQSLREELERTQEQLVQRENVAVVMGNEELKKQRLERLQALRTKHDSGTAPAVPDFSPPSSGASSWTPPSTSSPRRSSTEYRPPSSLLAHLEDADASDSSSCFVFPHRQKEPPLTEYALVSQLLLKIRELEETNAEISQQQLEATSRLRSAQRGAETMKRVYDYLSDEEDCEVEIVPHDDIPTTMQDDYPGNTTIRFSSLRRNIDDDIFNHILDEPEGFDNGIEGNMHSTVRTSSLVRPQKARKSVAGLFDGLSLRRANPSQSLLSPSGESNDCGSAIPPKVFSRNTSPIGSPLLPPGDGRTLGSELGSEFGEDWNVESENYHLRSTSLFSLAQGVGELSGLPSPSPIEPVKSSETDEDSGLQTKLKSVPPEDDRVPDLGSYREKSFSRTRRLSQTVRARTHKWVDRRFEKQPEPRPTHSELSAPTLLTKVFDTVVERIGGTPSSKPEVLNAQEDNPSTEDSKVVNVQSSDRHFRKHGVVGFLLELWLWLQFIIIIMVFLWAMAKRGPKSVLREADRKAKSRG